MSDAPQETISGPRAGFNTLIMPIFAIGFGIVLVIAWRREGNPWYLVGGLAVVALGVFFALLQEQTVVDLRARKWIRIKRSLFGSKQEDGPLDELASIGLHEGVDSKGYKTWRITLNRQKGRYIVWHEYTYLGEKGMRADVARLEAALGLPIIATAKTQDDD